VESHANVGSPEEALSASLNKYGTAKTSVQSAIANPWQKVRVAQNDQQQLAAIAAEFATAVGLAQRRNK
jgi:Tfp pilus assembly PilM family ATPase